MNVIPAIDILDSKLVRLTKGDPSTRVEQWNGNPIEAAHRWNKKGAKIIHIIDLDAALGKKRNTSYITRISNAIDSSLQVGGGIRSYKYAKTLLDAGIENIILGSMPIKTPEIAQRLIDEYGSERIIIALDHRNSLISVHGWIESTGLSIYSKLKDFIDLGYENFLVTSIEHDGGLSGPDIKTYRKISNKANIIASGGISSIQDIITLKKVGVKAVVIGKALYQNKFSFEEALEAARC